MRILKIISGVFLLLLSILLALSLLISTFNSVNRHDKDIRVSSPEGFGYVLGTLIAFCVMGAGIYYLSKFSLKLIRNKRKKVSELEEIGK